MVQNKNVKKKIDTFKHQVENVRPKQEIKYKGFQKNYLGNDFDHNTIICTIRLSPLPYEVNHGVEGRIYEIM